MFFSDFCIFSLFNLKLITSVHDDAYHPLQNHQLFAASGKKPHIDSLYQFCLVKVLLLTVAFEDGVRSHSTSAQNTGTGDLSGYFAISLAMKYASVFDAFSFTSASSYLLSTWPFDGNSKPFADDSFSANKEDIIL